MHTYLVVAPSENGGRRKSKILVSTRDIPTNKIYDNLPVEPGDFIPEYKVLTILTKNLGVSGSSILKRQMMKLSIEGPKIPVSRYQELIDMVEEASTLVASRSIRNKMRRELEELALRYRSN